MFRFFLNLPIQIKFILVMTVLSLVPLSILQSITTNIVQDALVENAAVRLVGSAEQTSASIDLFLSNTVQHLVSESQIFNEYLAQGAEDSEMQTYLTDLKKVNEFVLSYAILDERGVNIADVNQADISTDESVRAYFYKPFQTNLPYISPIYFTPDFNQPIFYISVPMRNVLGEPISVFRVRYSARILQTLLTDKQGARFAGPESYVALFDENLMVVAHSTQNNNLYKFVTLPSLARQNALVQEQRTLDRPFSQLNLAQDSLAESLEDAIDSPHFSFTDFTDTTQRVAVADLAEVPSWRVLVFQPEQTYLAPVRDISQQMLGVASILSLFVIFVAVGVGYRFSQPIRDLTHIVQEITDGNLSVRASVKSEDELGQLAAVFNNMGEQLQRSIVQMEDVISDRTLELQTSVRIGQEMTRIRDLATLLPTIVESIRSQFDLYYVHVYFIENDELVIKAGTGEVGQILLAQDHYVAIGNGSIVGEVAQTGQSIVVSDTSQSDMHKANPYLPFTRSELAVPLTIEGAIIGVLDMQHSDANRFTSANQAVFEAMGIQLAIAVDSARQWEYAQLARQRLEATIQQYVQESWDHKLQQLNRKQVRGYDYDGQEVVPLPDDIADKVADVADEMVTLPVKVQNHPIGELAIKLNDQQLTGNSNLLVNAIVEQLAQKAENLRLFEVTQAQAAREQVTRQIVDKIRASRNIETALQTAAVELTKALNAKRAKVDLKVRERG